MDRQYWCIVLVYQYVLKMKKKRGWKKRRHGGGRRGGMEEEGGRRVGGRGRGRSIPRKEVGGVQWAALDDCGLYTYGEEGSRFVKL